MNYEGLLFTFLVLFTLLTGAGVIINRNAVNGAMCLLLCLAGVAGLFVQLHAYLLAFLLILVYAGAVVALFLFIIMLLDVQRLGTAKTKPLSLAAGFIAACLLLLGLCSLANYGHLESPNLAQVPEVGSSLKEYAYALFTTYLLPVQIIGFLLLIAMLGVIVLSKRLESTEEKA